MEEEMGAEVRGVYDNLVGIRSKLASMKNERHTMEELRKYQQMLDALDTKRERLGVCARSMQAPGQAACMEVLDDSYDLLEHLIATASDLSTEMNHLYTTLCGILKKLKYMKSRNLCSLEDLRHYQQMLNSIDNKREQGVFLGSPTTSIPPGQAVCAAVLAQCYELVDELRPVSQDMTPEMDAIFNRLLTLKQKLLCLKVGNVKHILSHLHPFQVELDEIDKERKDGVFAGSLKSVKVPAGQAVCSDLLDECYQLVRDLQSSALDYDVPGAPAPAAAVQ